jgi:hypothetical protein
VGSVAGAIESRKSGMAQEKIKIPTQGGLDRARRRLKDLRKKDPSPELVKIIDDVTREQPPNKPESNTDDGIAARPCPRDLDL